MEIRINKEIRRYQESIFFGLTFRQFLCSTIAVAAAVAVYFGFREQLGSEMVSWLCVLAAAPVAAAGFVKYQGMTLERFIIAWVKSEFLRAGRRPYMATNYFYTILKGGR